MPEYEDEEDQGRAPNEEAEEMEQDITKMDLAQLSDRFAELAVSRSEHEEIVESLKRQQEELKEYIMIQMQETGINRLRSEKHGRTIYLRSQLWAGAADGDRERMVDALNDAGMSDMVIETVSTQTLSAWARELATQQDKDVPDLPPELEGAIQLTERFDIRAVRSK